MRGDKKTFRNIVILFLNLKIGRPGDEEKGKGRPTHTICSSMNLRYMWRYYIKDIPEHGYRYSGLKSKDMKNNQTTHTVIWQLLHLSC